MNNTLTTVETSSPLHVVDSPSANGSTEIALQDSEALAVGLGLHILGKLHKPYQLEAAGIVPLEGSQQDVITYAPSAEGAITLPDDTLTFAVLTSPHNVITSQLAALEQARGGNFASLITRVLDNKTVQACNAALAQHQEAPSAQTYVNTVNAAMRLLQKSGGLVSGAAASSEIPPSLRKPAMLRDLQGSFTGREAAVIEQALQESLVAGSETSATAPNSNQAVLGRVALADLQEAA